MIAMLGRSPKYHPNVRRTSFLPLLLRASRFVLLWEALKHRWFRWVLRLSPYWEKGCQNSSGTKRAEEMQSSSVSILCNSRATSHRILPPSLPRPTEKKKEQNKCSWLEPQISLLEKTFYLYCSPILSTTLLQACILSCQFIMYSCRIVLLAQRQSARCNCLFDPNRPLVIHLHLRLDVLM